MGIHKNLDYWDKIEYFTTFNVPKNDKNIKSGNYPWVYNKQDNVKYYIYIGVYQQKEANQKILSYLNKEDDNIEATGTNLTCLAILELDYNGNYIEDSFTMPTFPWAVMMLLAGKINSNCMVSEFNSFKYKVTLELSRIFNKDFINTDKLKEFFIILRNTLKWAVDINFNEDENCFYRYKIIKASKNESKNVENPVLLNSFYIDEIENIIKAVKKNEYGKAFGKYASLNKSEAKYKEDIDCKSNDKGPNKYLIRETSPIKIPNGRWPSKDDSSLMQQVAANICASKLSNEEINIFSVNGPPGTGKTTLLRDIIADILVKEADKLVEYSKPQDAFKKTKYQEVINFNGGSDYAFYLYELDKKLHDNGILITSCNNNAVENISKELPNIKEIYFDDSTKDYIDYFSELSKRVFDTDDVWGMISVSLGKNSNRRKFADPLINAYNSDLKKWFGVTDDNYFNWNDIKEKYNKTKNKIEKIKKGFYEAEKAKDKIKSYKKDINDKMSQFNMYSFNILDISDDIKVKEKEKREKKENLEIIKCELDIYKMHETSWIKRLFHIKSKHRYLKQKSKTSDKYELICNQYEAVAKEYEKLIDLLKHIKNKSTLLTNEIATLNINIKEEQKIIDISSNDLGKNYPENYWNEDYKYVQTNCPWIEGSDVGIEKDNNLNSYIKLNDLRNELFFLALQVHKSFIIEAQTPFKNNLFIFLKMLNGEISSEKSKKNSMINDLWHTFFLFVPVVSSTFASVGRLLSDLKEESLGWLLIDEAGQALPQMALGAIWRSKRVVVVGDPLQVEPVSTVPQYLLDAIAKDCDVLELKNKEMSVQSIADSINQFGAYLKNNLWVGCPLRVHRRCENPMFSISNEIAYDNKMVFGTKTKFDLVSSVFISEWIDVGGKSSGNKNHYIENQGNKVLEILKKCFECLQPLQFPEVYVISPFTTVVYGIKMKMMKELEPFLLNELWRDVNTKEFNKNFKEWLDESIGTVHTFQGKETNLVIICLGVDEYNLGAVLWAAKAPNILNVAITRSKQKCIIIGDKKLWGDKPYFEVAEKLMR